MRMRAERRVCGQSDAFALRARSLLVLSRCWDREGPADMCVVQYVKDIVWDKYEDGEVAHAPMLELACALARSARLQHEFSNLLCTCRSQYHIST
eukprot:1790947-Rhodomonas_salina.1